MLYNFAPTVSQFMRRDKEVSGSGCGNSYVYGHYSSEVSIM